jgi:hypothetical protein
MKKKLSCGHRELIIFNPSYDFIKSLEDKEIAYVMRTQKGFIREEELGTAVDRWVALGKSGKQVRTIVVDLDSGEREILITNHNHKSNC